MATTPTIYKQPSVRRLVQWTPQQLRNAELRADGGDLSLAAELCEEMLGDERFKAVADSRAGALLGAPIEFQKGGDKRRAGRAVRALEVDEDFWEAFPDSELAATLTWGRILGVVPMQKVWTKRENGRVIPKIEVWSPRFLKWDWNLREWRIRVAEGSGYKEVALDPAQWILYTPYGAERPWTWGAWRGLSRWWLLKRYAVLDWALYSERHGGGVLVGVAPEGASDDVRRALAADIDNLGANGSIGLPAGFDLKWVSDTADTYSTFTKQIEFADRGFAIGLLGGNLTTEAGTTPNGANAAAKSQNDGPLLDRTRSDNQTLSACLHDGALKEWAELNFGDAKLAPWPNWLIEPPADLKARADTLNVFADAATKLDSLGVDIEPLLEDYGLDLRPEGAPPLKPPAPAPTPPPNANDPNADPNAPPPPPKKQVRALRATPLLEGQLYTDAVGDHALRRGADALLPELVKVLAEVDAANGLEDLRSRLRTVLGDMDPDAFAKVVEHAIVLSDLAGQLAVVRERDKT